MSEDQAASSEIDAIEDAESCGPVRVVSIHVDGLVGRTKPLTLPLADDHPVLLTGSSGSGKSTLLRGIHAVATGNFPVLAALPMRRLRLERAGAPDIVAERHEREVTIAIGDESFIYHHGDADPRDPDEDRYSPRGLPRLLRMEGALTTRLAYEALRGYFSEHVVNEAPWLIEQLSDLSIPYIADDRLFALADQDVPSPIRVDPRTRGYRAQPSPPSSFRTVDIVGSRLRNRARDEAVRTDHFVTAIDGELPNRVIEAVRGGDASADAVADELKAIDELQTRLDRFDLGGRRQSTVIALSADSDARERAVLLAVLKTNHEKLRVRAPFLEDLERFIDAVNRRFRRKHLVFSARYGLRVVLDDKPVFPPEPERPTMIRLDMLSSGEQHLVVLLYQLIFGSPKGSLYLVDEPELSLHVAWQRELASDLADIAAHKESRYLIATHSPSVISGHLDWEINFDDLDVD